MAEVKSYEIKLELSAEDFEQSMGRKPTSEEEFDEWARLAEKGLLKRCLVTDGKVLVVD